MLNRRSLLKLIGFAPAASVIPALAALPEAAPEPKAAPIEPEVASKDGDSLLFCWNPVEGAAGYSVTVAVGASKRKKVYRTEACRLRVPAKYGDRFFVKIAAVYPDGVRGNIYPDWSFQ